LIRDSTRFYGQNLETFVFVFVIVLT